MYEDNLWYKEKEAIAAANKIPTDDYPDDDYEEDFDVEEMG